MWKGIGALLANNPTKKGVMRGVEAALTVQDAERVILDIFPKLASHGKVESVANGVLVIRVGTNIGMQEVALRKTLLMRALSDRGIPVRDLRVRINLEPQNEYDL